MPDTKILYILPQPFLLSRGSSFRAMATVNALTELGYQVDLLCYPLGIDPQKRQYAIHRSRRPPLLTSVKIGPSPQKVIFDIPLACMAHRMVRRNGYAVIHGVEEAGFIASWLGRKFNVPYIYRHALLDVAADRGRQLSHEPAAAESLQETRIAGDESGPGDHHRRPGDDRDPADPPGAGSLCRHPARLSPGLRRWSGDRRTPGGYQPAVFRPTAQDDPLYRQFPSLPGDRSAAGRNQGAEERLWLDVFPSPCCWSAAGKARPKSVAAYRQKAADLGIAEEVVFCGAHPAEAMPIFMDRADLLVSSRSTGNNVPLKVYTYLASGRLLVATNIPSHTQVLNAGNCLLADPEPKALARTLYRGLVEMPRGRTAAACGRGPADRRGRTAPDLQRRAQGLLQSLHPVKPFPDLHCLIISPASRYPGTTLPSR